ncbi:MAG TPA: hypothetical protein VK745_11135 [Polyangiaceae bacterium]|nr:hypothetical protein [Polyangiaceae bacterium]
MRLSSSMSLLLLGLSACRSQAVEPAPAPARFELVVAPPGARGARAAGTDAAPPAPTEIGSGDPDEQDDPEQDADGGTDPDSGVATPDPDAGGVAL